MSPAVRVRLDIAYDGARFHGWQIQPQHRTVQGVLRHELTRLLGYPVTPVGAGRTDAGVHAHGQVAHLDVRDVREYERLVRALARTMPEDIDIRAISRVSGEFNARFSARARRYRYRILRGRDVFDPHCWQIYFDVDRRAMDHGARELLGRHDFSSFCKTSSLKPDGNFCEVDLCRFEWSPQGAMFEIRANRFLHHMVRVIVGTLVEIGRGARPAGDMPVILAAHDRRRAGRMAPARGLFLEEVTYPEHLLVPPADQQDQGESP